MSDIREQLEQLGLGQTRMLRPYLRPVHRGLRHRRSERRKGAVGGAEIERPGQGLECLSWVTCGPSQTDRFGSVAGESGSSRREGPELGVFCCKTPKLRGSGPDDRNKFPITEFNESIFLRSAFLGIYFYSFAPITEGTEFCNSIGGTPD